MRTFLTLFVLLAAIVIGHLAVLYGAPGRGEGAGPSAPGAGGPPWPPGGGPSAWNATLRRSVTACSATGRASPQAMAVASSAIRFLLHIL